MRPTGRLHPGNESGALVNWVELQNQYDYYKVLSDDKTTTEVDQGCRSAGIGCVECQAIFFEKHWAYMSPLCERPVCYVQKHKELLEVLESGATQVRKVVAETMGEVRERIQL